MPKQDSLIQLVLSRLERISVDSPLAHKASGIRGSLLRSLERQSDGLPVDHGELEGSLSAALAILKQAAAAARPGQRRG